MPGVNPYLLLKARERVKRAFVPSDAAAQGGGAPPGPPPGGDPSMGGGAPPMDPSMMGGGGGAPPMDPSMMGGGGGAPPMDPSMMGGDPSVGGGGGAPPMDPSMMGGADVDAKVEGAVQRALQAAGLGNQGGNGGPGSPKQPKPDINTIATDLFQLKKMFLAYLRRQGVELPPDILDGPNRDPATGAPAISPSGGSDVSPGSSGPTAQGAIQPIPPIQPAFLNAIAGGKQASAADPMYLVKVAADVLHLRWLCSRNGWYPVEKAAADLADVYGNPAGPGRAYGDAARAVGDHAAAVARMFRVR